MDVVHRLLDEIGEKDAEGHVTLGGCKVRFGNAAVSCLWMGRQHEPRGRGICTSDERETGCLIADVDCGRVIDPGKLAGLNGKRTEVIPPARGR